MSKEDEVFSIGEMAVGHANAEPAVAPASEPAQTQAENTDDLVGRGEHVIVVVHRHWAGVAAMYGLAAAVVLALVVLGAYVIPGLNLSSGGKAMLVLAAIFVSGLFLAILLTIIYIYHKSSLTLTDKSCVQMVQRSLFNKKISRLSMSNVEDVNVEHGGILPNIFGYGTLTIQTAGEEDNFVFPFCPEPNKYAEQILEARQAYVQHHPGEIEE